MASIDQCRGALDELASRLDGWDSPNREKKIPDRTMSLHIMDHDVMFVGRLHRGSLIDIEQVDPESPKADIRLSMSSDDLIALTQGDLSFAHAWASGRVRLDASLRDLLRLRSMGR